MYFSALDSIIKYQYCVNICKAVKLLKNKYLLLD